jgi:hypothetical protein
MAESLLSFDSDGTTVFCNGNHYLWLRLCNYGCFYKRSLSYILMLFGLTGLSALFSFMVFMDKNMGRFS